MRYWFQNQQDKLCSQKALLKLVVSCLQNTTNSDDSFWDTSRVTLLIDITPDQRPLANQNFSQYLHFSVQFYQKNPRKLKQLLLLFGLIFFSYFPFFCHKISFALDLIIQGKHAKQFGIHFFIYLRAYTQLVKITIVLLTSTALYQCKPVQQLACQVLAFQVTLPTYAVGFCFARWKVTYSANCTT